MKKTFWATLLLCCLFSVYAQKRELGPLPLMQPAENQHVATAKGLSGSSAFMVLDIIGGKAGTKEFALQYGVFTKNGKSYVQAFARMAQGHSTADLERFGVRAKYERGGMIAVQIPVNQFVALSESGICSWIDIGVKGHPALDSSRTVLGINDIYNGVNLPQCYDGTGVVVGIIDVGFEYGHPAFYDSTGTSLRIKRVWQQEDTLGTAPTSYGYGSEYITTSAILGARRSSTSETHGTHVAGIAAGCGGNNATGRRYRGMAPNADIVLVATNMMTSGIYDGIEYILDYSLSVGKPCVINMSIGSHMGPHDGTSSFDMACDTLLSYFPSKLLLVGAAGNEGDSKLHIGKTFSATDTLLYTIVDFNGSSAGYTSIDIWGADTATRFMAGLGIIDTTTGRFVASGNFYYSWANNSSNFNLTDTDNETVYCAVYQNGSYTNNGHNNISFIVNSNGQSHNNQKVILVVKAFGGSINAWTNKGSFINGGFNVVSAGNTNSTVGEIGGVCKSIITVGSYTSRQSWTALSGRQYNTYSTVGDLSYFSSHGPTADNRVKPDITAPGEWIAAPINRFNSSYVNSIYTCASTTFGGNTEYYATMQGTSMATPTVTGILALWMQQDTALGLDSAMAKLRRSAITDGFTGNIPAAGSNLWGKGKINPLGGLPYTAPSSYTITVTSGDTTKGTVSGSGTYATGTTATIRATPRNGYRFVHWSDNDTHAVRQITVNRNMNFVATFDYIRYTVTVTSSDTTKGTVRGGGTYTAGSSVTIRAIPRSGYRLVRWNDNDTHLVRQITVNSNMNFVATFDETPYVECTPITQFAWNNIFDSDLSCWRNVDADGDGYKWSFLQVNSVTCAVSESYSVLDSTYNALDPDNWLISRPLVLPANAQLNWSVMAYNSRYFNEHYSVYISTTGNEPRNFSTVLHSETLSSANPSTMTKDLSQYAGQTVRIAFRHHNCPDVVALILYDISVTQQQQGIDDASASEPEISTNGLRITVSGVGNEPVRIIDTWGRMIVNGTCENGTYQMPCAGVYMVQVGNRKAVKVVVSATNR